MGILNFLLTYWDSILLVAVLLTVLIVLYVKGEKRILDLITFAALTEAERQYKGGTGPLKKSAVIAKIYSIIPVILKIIISEDQIGRWIETALAAAKKKWAENTAIENYIKGEEPENLPP
ncbi:MAG: hypothetical protein ACYCWE_09555 [Eubacteriales bacterium]